MSPCIGCAVFAKDESGHDLTWQPEWANTVCPKCNREFKQGDRLAVVMEALDRWASEEDKR